MESQTKINKSKIDWPFPNLHTWNPVIGCPRNCFDGQCWAFKTNERLKNIEKITGRKTNGWVEDFSKPTIIQKQHNPIFPDKPAHIFVGSRSDICFWEHTIIERVIHTCTDNPKHTFVFLTKNSVVYISYEFPNNCILGLTLTGKENKRVKSYQISWLIEYHTRNKLFLSVEPLLSHVGTVMDTINLVIVGAQSGKNAISPKKEWIEMRGISRTYFYALI